MVEYLNQSITYFDIMQPVQCVSGNNARLAHSLHAADTVVTSENCWTVLLTSEALRYILSAETL